MSDQAFVKAFARRKNSTGNESTQRGVVRSERVTPPPAELPDQPGSIELDRSVESTAQVWVDPTEDQIARADPPVMDVPKPHVEPTATEIQDSQVASRGESVDPAQHIHTAYATSFPDPSLFADAENVIEVESPVETESPAETESPVETGSPVEIESQVAPSPSVHVDTLVFETECEPEPSVEVEPVAAPEPIVESPFVGEFESPAVPEPIAEPATYAPFQAVWEVDVFDVPTPVADLFFEGTLFQQIAERMSEAVSSGLKSVLVTSAKTGEGRSSVAIGIAMAAAASGIRVALVDADTEDPTLADDLRLDLRYGWVDTVRGGLPIKEVAVHAVEDGVTLIPLMPPSGHNAATAFEVVQLVDLLKDKFELVIIDGPTSQSVHIHQCASVVDSAIIVRDNARTDALAINELSYRLRESGVQGVGVVENFV